ncbi:MAG: hypothetical protein ACM3QZ_03330 [Solirubrobacterales bacterium]
MSFPSIPRITPCISLNRTQVVDLLLSSIALEEMGLAHIINAEGEKLQTVLANFQCKGEPGSHHCESSASCANIAVINREVRRTLQTVLKSQMLLQFKLEDILDTQPLPPPRPPCPPHPPHPPHAANLQCKPPNKSSCSHQESMTEHPWTYNNEPHYSAGCQSCKMAMNCPKRRVKW